MPLFTGFSAEDASQFFNSILTEIIDQKMVNRKSAYSEQIHLSSEGDFNLSLKISGEGSLTEDSTLCASDFELIVVSLAKENLHIPVYRTDINPDSLYDRPAPLSPGFLTATMVSR